MEKYIFLFCMVLILIIFYLYEIKKDFFTNNNYPFNPSTQTPQSNYLEIAKKLEDQDNYKYDLSVALSPTPTIQCHKLNDKDDCNNNGCNWFGSYCSAMYPSYL